MCLCEPGLDMQAVVVLSTSLVQLRHKYKYKYW